MNKKVVNKNFDIFIWVCYDCALEHSFEISERRNWHEGYCDCCKKIKAVKQNEGFKYIL